MSSPAPVSSRLLSPPPAIPLVTGKFITPLGTQTNVGSYPNNALVSPDGKYLVVTTLGARTRLAVLNAADGSPVSQEDFTGKSPRNEKKKEGLVLRAGVRAGDAERDACSMPLAAPMTAISVFLLSADGKLTRQEKDIVTPSPIVA